MCSSSLLPCGRSAALLTGSALHRRCYLVVPDSDGPTAAGKLPTLTCNTHEALPAIECVVAREGCADRPRRRRRSFLPGTCQRVCWRTAYSLPPAHSIIFSDTFISRLITERRVFLSR